MAPIRRAIYAAWEREPKNPNVAETIRAGLKSVALFSEHTPRDVLEWLIDFHNSYHSGSTFTLVQHFTLTSKIEAERKVYCAMTGYSQSALRGARKCQAPGGVVGGALPGKV